MLVVINILGSNGTYTNNVANKALTASKETINSVEPFTNGIDKIVGKYIMNDNNYNKID